MTLEPRPPEGNVQFSQHFAGACVTQLSQKTRGGGISPCSLMDEQTDQGAQMTPEVTELTGGGSDSEGQSCCLSLPHTFHSTWERPKLKLNRGTRSCPRQLKWKVRQQPPLTCPKSLREK